MRLPAGGALIALKSIAVFAAVEGDLLAISDTPPAPDLSIASIYNNRWDGSADRSPGVTACSVLWFTIGPILCLEQEILSDQSYGGVKRPFSPLI
jgi:hypothetical protein